jgi:hypothetical protein
MALLGFAVAEMAGDWPLINDKKLPRRSQKGQDL